MSLSAARDCCAAAAPVAIRPCARSRPKSHIAALQNLEARTVDVYTFQAAIEGFVTPVLSDYYKQYPNVPFNIIASSTDRAG
jgi:hypothetical protein